MVLATLKAATLNEHEALEQAVKLMDPGLTVPMYVEIVRTFHAFVAQWEEFARKNCPAPLRETFLLRQREGMLLADLEFFGVAPLAVRPQLPELTLPGSFYGAMYVMEGSSLGGRIIARHLEKQFGFHDGAGYAYFYGHGGDTGRLWKEFCLTVEEQSAELEIDSVVAGAQQMFTLFREWILANEEPASPRKIEESRLVDSF